MSIEYHIGTPSYYSRPAELYVYKPLTIDMSDAAVKDAMRRVMEAMREFRKKETVTMSSIQVTFNVVGGGTKTFNLSTSSELAELHEGDTAEITHQKENWNGSYEVLERIENSSGIVYTLRLTALELRHTKGGHNKRWLASTKDGGKTVLFRWGKIGGTLQSMEKVFPNYRAGAIFLHEKIEEKLKKGYNQK